MDPHTPHSLAISPRPIHPTTTHTSPQSISMHTYPLNPLHNPHFHASPRNTPPELNSILPIIQCLSISGKNMVPESSDEAQEDGPEIGRS